MPTAGWMLAFDTESQNSFISHAPSFCTPFQRGFMHHKEPLWWIVHWPSGRSDLIDMYNFPIQGVLFSASVASNVWFLVLFSLLSCYIATGVDLKVWKCFIHGPLHCCWFLVLVLLSLCCEVCSGDFEPWDFCSPFLDASRASWRIALCMGQNGLRSMKAFVPLNTFSF